MIQVSICIISYNQEKYIAQAIESALMQHVNFETEIVICDDCSADNTLNIIQSYATKHPQKIKTYPASKNMGMLCNWERALKLCNGKYIALLEGDDFWNDEYKLYKQYQILETNSGYSICFTNAHIKYENSNRGEPYYVTLTDTIFTTADLLNYNFIPTCSVLMRNNVSDTFFPGSYFKSPFADWIIHILNSRFGNIYFLNECSCTYRMHDAGVWGGLNEVKQLKNKLRAIECIAEILHDKKLEATARINRQQIIGKLCAYYYKRKQVIAYLEYRIKLLLN